VIYANHEPYVLSSILVQDREQHKVDLRDRYCTLDGSSPLVMKQHEVDRKGGLPDLNWIIATEE
jgi:hypothetical protein